ncbi:MAG: hypothetical protein K0S27_1111 [Gammaproteobacteria bacterium]|jgi:hypothetical protein|nr:hypothetical protein [Gammaproteobacteria bacterium]
MVSCFICWNERYRAAAKAGGAVQVLCSNPEAWATIQSLKLHYSYTLQELRAIDGKDLWALVKHCVKEVDTHVRRVAFPSTLIEESPGGEQAGIEGGTQTRSNEKMKRNSFFSKEEEERIDAFFGKDMLVSLNQLQRALRICNTIDGMEQAELKNSHCEYEDEFKILITALKSTPARKLTPQEASQDRAIIKIANAAAQLHEYLKLKSDERGLRALQFLSRILGGILAAAPAALGGFKAGAALGAMVGGGLGSVPTALVGGCAGAILGANIGFWGGYKLGNGTANFFSSRCAQADYSKILNETVEKAHKGLIIATR